MILGSVLDLLLFLLDAKDVFDVIENGTLLLYAEDIKIVYTFCSEALESTVSNIAQDLVSLNSWANDCMISSPLEKAASWDTNKLYPA